MSRDIERRRQPAVELARLLEAAAHSTLRPEGAETAELDEFRNLASELRGHPAGGIRPEFRAALRSRLLEEARAVDPAPPSAPPTGAALRCPRRTSPIPAFVRTTREPAD